MYLYNRWNRKPGLALKLNEPRLLSVWSNNFPLNTLTRLWGLNIDRQNEWWTHFQDKIVTPNVSYATVDSNGIDLIPGLVASQSVAATHRRFEAWMDSCENDSVFSQIKLKTLADEVGTLATLMLLENLECDECDASIPAFMFVGTDANSSRFYPEYEFVKLTLNNPIFETVETIPSCFRCDSSLSVTPNMQRFMARSINQCHCMPCRGRL